MPKERSKKIEEILVAITSDKLLLRDFGFQSEIEKVGQN